MKRLFLLISIMLIILPLSAEAQIKPRSVAQTPSTKVKNSTPTETKVKAQTPATAQQDLVILEIENRDIYISLENTDLEIGSMVDAMGNAGYFIHPVSKKKIQKQAQPIARLKVEKVYKDYALCSPLEWDDINKLKSGMVVMPVEEDIEIPEGDVDNHITPEPTKEEVFSQLVESMNSLCPIRQEKQYIESYVIDGQRLIINHVLENKKLYNNIKKLIEKGKFYTNSSKNKENIKNQSATEQSATLLVLAKDLNYKIVERWYNKDKSKFIDSYPVEY